LFNTYYVVFDQTPSIERNSVVNQIAWAPKSTTGIEVQAASSSGYVSPVISPTNKGTNSDLPFFNHELKVTLIVCLSVIFLTIVGVCIMYHKCKTKDEHRIESIMEAAQKKDYTESLDSEAENKTFVNPYGIN